MGKGGKGKGGKGKGKGGGKSYEPEGPPDEIEEVGEALHPCEDELVIKCTNERIPHFNARIFLENKEEIGKIDEIFGPINTFYCSAKLAEGMKAESFKAGKKIYIDTMKLLPLSRFLPQPSGGGKGKGGKGKGKPGGGYDGQDASLRVFNLADDVREGDLQDLFAACGRLQRVFLAKDMSTGQSKGFAFITYYNKEDAQRAIDKLNGHGYDNLIMKVEWAKPRA
mmetsp:Transcript_49737/g.89315  ORF Transcript_49737/g.89315 Transcript_49737/m.89315 type:complete len:224 (+) Transcript_49737:71-742(+)